VQEKAATAKKRNAMDFMRGLLSLDLVEARQDSSSVIPLDTVDRT